MAPVREKATSALLGLVMLPGLFFLGLPVALIVLISFMGLVAAHPALGMVVPLCLGAAVMCRAGTLELSRVSRAILCIVSAAMLVSAGSIGVVCSAGCMEYTSWYSNAIDTLTLALVVMGVIAAIAAMTANRRTALLLVGTAATVTLVAFLVTVSILVYGFPAADD